MEIPFGIENKHNKQILKIPRFSTSNACIVQDSNPSNVLTLPLKPSLKALQSEAFNKPVLEAQLDGNNRKTAWNSDLQWNNDLIFDHNVLVNYANAVNRA